MANYMSVDRGLLLQAFRHAHVMAETAERGHERKEFRRIAKLIWDACGEEKAMPDNIYGLSTEQFALVEALTPAQLDVVRSKIRSLDYTDDQTRDAVGQHIAAGGNIADLLNGGH